MAIEELGYVIVETTQAEQWDVFMTDVVGVMIKRGITVSMVALSGSGLFQESKRD